jgi:hypothetical protein
MALSVKDVKFTPLQIEAPTKLDLVVEGLDGVGKTFFGLTAPGPVAVHCLEDGMDRALTGFPPAMLEKLQAAGLYKFDYEFPMTRALPGGSDKSLVEACGAVWAEFAVNARASVDKCRTNIMDTGSRAWELLRLARHGKLTQVMPIQYTQVNLEFTELLQVLHRSQANNIWLHRLKPAYEKDKLVAGKYERQGFGDIGYEVDAVLRLTFDEMDGLRLRFGKCVNRALTGTTIMGAENITFPKVAALIYPSRPEEFWTF